MQTVSIRKCTPGDELALSMVGQATFLETFAGVLSGSDVLGHCVKQHSVNKYAAWLNDPDSAIWVAEVEPGQAPVGYLVLTTPDLPLPDLSPQDLEVKRIYLLHRFHGLGLGARLMNEAHAFAQSGVTRRLLLGVYAHNSAAISFYRKLGYTQVGQRSFKVEENTYDDFIFAFHLIR